MMNCSEKCKVQGSTFKVLDVRTAHRDKKPDTFYKLRVSQRGRE